MNNQISLQNSNSINLSIRSCEYEHNNKQLIARLRTPINYPLTVNSYSIDVGYCNPVNFEAMKTLASSISALRELTHLNLKFDTKTLDLQTSTNEQIEYLKNEFYKLPLLESLSIRIKNSFTDDAQMNIISQMFSLQTQLKNFNIELEDSLITDLGLLSLNQLIQSLSNLQQLSISITNNQRTTNEKQYLCLWDSVNLLNKLEYLKVFISDCNIQKNVGQESKLQQYSQMGQLKTLSFKLQNKNNNNNDINNDKDSTVLIKEFSNFLKYLPKLEQLLLEFGDDCKIDSAFLKSITQNALQLNYLKFYFGENCVSSNQQSVENLLRNLTKETQSLLEIQSENEFILISMKNKENKIILDLKIAKDSHHQELIFLRAIFLGQSRFIKKLKLNFRRLLGFEDILNRCDLSNLEELEIQAISDDQNMSIIIELLMSIPKSKLQFLYLKTKDIYSTLNDNLTSRLENQLSSFTALKKINFDFGVKTMQFTLQNLIHLLLQFLANEECELNVKEINLKYDQALDKYFYFDIFIKKLQSCCGGYLYIHLDYVDQKIIITNNRNIQFKFQVCKDIINQFIKGILFNSHSFQSIKNCKIKQTTDQFTTVLSRPYFHLNQKQTQQNANLLSKVDFSKYELISFMKQFSAYKYESQHYYEKSDISYFYRLTKISLNVPFFYVDGLISLIKLMKSVKDLKIIVSMINNDILNSLSCLQNLEILSLQLDNSIRRQKDYPIEVNDNKLIQNQNIRYIKIKTKGLRINKKKILKIFKRKCKRLVVI